MLIRYGFQITITAFQPTPVLARLDVHPDRRGDIRSESQFTVSGFEAPPARIDVHGNLCRRLIAYPGDATLTLSGVIEDQGMYEAQLTNEPAWAVENLPDDALTYLLGSRYCETDQLSSTAWQLFGYLPEGAPRVHAILDYVHNHLTFGYGFARNTRTAAQALNERVGVCRDFAHLTIALCRCLNIPARYVNGYLGDIGVPLDPAPMDFSAWVEVFLDGRWYTVDARHNTPRIGRIVIARGRDATDVPMLHTFGPHSLKEFSVITEEIPPEIDQLSADTRIAA
jgi:transglutaminase-like putative cysteine protease